MPYEIQKHLVIEKTCQRFLPHCEVLEGCGIFGLIKAIGKWLLCTEMRISKSVICRTYQLISTNNGSHDYR